MWNIDKHKTYIENLRLNLERISDEFHNAIINSNFDLPLSLLIDEVYNATESMKKRDTTRKVGFTDKRENKS